MMTMLEIDKTHAHWAQWCRDAAAHHMELAKQYRHAGGRLIPGARRHEQAAAQCTSIADRIESEQSK